MYENDRLFCEIGIDLKLFSPRDAEDALEQQKIDEAIGVRKPVGAYLFESKLINRDQIRQIIKMQDRIIAERAINPKQTKSTLSREGNLSKNEAHDDIEEISDEEIEKLSLVLFTPFNQAVEKYQSYNEIEDCLPLMEPDYIQEMLNNSISKMLSVISSEHKQAREKFDEQLCTNFLLEEAHHYKTYFSSYSNEYHRYLQFAGHLDEDANDKCKGAGLIGGVIGSLFGEGAAIIGSAIAGGLMGEEIDKDVQKRTDHLCKSYGKLMEMAEELLKEVGNRSIHVIESLRKKSLKKLPAKM